MIKLAEKHQLRIYALDFWGFGDSAKSTPQSYEIDSYVEMVAQFMDRLGIVKSPVVGHSMGGTVALKFALKHPSLVTKVAVVGSPIIGETLNFFLKLSGYSWVADIVWKYPLIRDMTMRILLYGDSKYVRNMISRDIRRTNMQPFFRSISDLRRTDLTAELAYLDIPTLGIFGERDNIVSPSNAETLQKCVADSNVVVLHKSRHFPMADEPADFIQTLIEFLDDQPVTLALPKPVAHTNGSNGHASSGEVSPSVVK